MNLKFILGLCVLISGLVLSGTGLRILLRPAEYEATVEIRVEPDVVSDVPCGNEPNTSYYDPYFLETQFKVIGSPVVLSNVIENLNLDEEWGKRYADGKKFTSEETMVLLRRRMDLRQPLNTQLVEIGVRDENPDEAALIANAIANAYRDYRNEQHKQQAIVGIQMLEKDYKAEEAKVERMRAQLEKLRKQLNITNNEPPDDIYDYEARYEAYVEAQAQLNNKMNACNLLAVKIEQLKTNSGTDIKSLQEAYQAEGTKVKTLQAQLEDLRKQLNITSNEPPDNVLSNHRAYYEAKQNLDTESTLRDLLKAKIESVKADTTIPFANHFVTIISPAVAPQNPVGPNRPLGAALSLCGLAMSVFGVYLLRALIIRKVM